MSNAAAAQWVKFFNAAGIPSPAAASYAHIFVENRIQNDMLMDLNKEYLREMGITPMGDVIAILRHAKTVSDQTAREKVLIGSEMNVPIAAVAAHPQLPVERSLSGNKIRLTSRSSTPPSVHNSTNSDSSSRNGGSSRLKSSATIVTPLPKHPRRVLPEHEGKYKIKLPTGTTERSKEILAKQAKLYSDREIVAQRPHVFERLAKSTTRTVDLGSLATDSELNDNDSESSESERESSKMRIRIMGNAGKTKPSTISNNSSIFSRLGGKTADDPDNALMAKQIKPILKNAQQTQHRSAIVKAKTLTSAVHVRPTTQKVILVKKVPLKTNDTDDDDDDIDNDYTDNDVDMTDDPDMDSVVGNSEKFVKFASTAEVREIAVSPRFRRSPTNQRKRHFTNNDGGGVKSRLGLDNFLHTTKKTYNVKAASNIHTYKKRISPVKIKTVRMKSDELMLRPDLPVHKRLGTAGSESSSAATRKTVAALSNRIRRVNLAATVAHAKKRNQAATSSKSNNRNTASVFDRLGFGS